MDELHGSRHSVVSEMAPEENKERGELMGTAGEGHRRRRLQMSFPDTSMNSFETAGQRFATRQGSAAATSKAWPAR
jgi:hypothetical protein